MSRSLSRFVDVRPGEGRLVLLAALVLFGLIAAHTMLETARDALFLGKLAPVRLTQVYALLAGITLIATRLNGRFVLSFGRRNALVCTLIFAAFGTVLFYLLPKSPTAVFLLYPWSGLLSTVMVVQFWMLAGQTFTVTQGKRLFGLMAAGGVLGAVVGASLAIPALRMASVETLLLGAATIFLATAALVTILEPDEVERDVRHARRRSAWRGGMKKLRRQPYLLRLGILTALATATVLVTDFLFKSVAARTFSPDQLGEFFAQYYAVLNTIALVVQVVIAGTLVRRTGTIVAFVVLPLLLVLGAGSVLVTGSALAAVLLTKGADGALRHSLHRISVELLWMPVPDETRATSKAVIDAVVVRLSQAGAAAGLFALGMAGLDQPPILAAFILVFAVAWVVLGLGLRRPYLELFRSAIHRDSPESSRAALQLDLRSVEVVVEALSSRDPDRVLAAMELLDSNDRSRLIPGLILYHESDAVLMRALQIIGMPERRDWIPLGERLMTHPNEAVRVEALKALARAGVTEPLEGRLLDVSPNVRGQAAFWLAQAAPEPPRQHPAVAQIIEMEGHAGCRAIVGLLRAVQDSGEGRWAELLSELATHEDPAVSEAAVAGMVQVRDARFIPILVQQLARRERRSMVREALVGLGDLALDALERGIRDHSLPLAVRIHLPRTVSRFRNQRAADILMDTLTSENHGVIRFKALRGLGRLVTEADVEVDSRRIEQRTRIELRDHVRLLALWHPLWAARDGFPDKMHAGLDLLLQLLNDKQRQALERTFRLLQISHPHESIQSVAVALQSSDRKVRAKALEYIDALTLGASLPEIRTLLRIIGDDLPPEERLQRALPHLDDPPADWRTSLAKLLREPDDAVSGLAAYFALELGEEDLKEEVATVSQERSQTGALISFIELMAATEEPTGVI
jgi:HEAT repeat protein